MVPFTATQQLRDEVATAEIIEAVGFDATLHLRRFAASLDPETSATLLRVAEVIEERQGLGWIPESI